MTPADLKAALVEAGAKSLCCPIRAAPPFCKEPGFGPCLAVEKHGAAAARFLSALPAVLERAGCKVTNRWAPEPTAKTAGERIGVPGPDAAWAYAFVHDAAPRVPWEKAP